MREGFWKTGRRAFPVAATLRFFVIFCVRSLEKRGDAGSRFLSGNGRSVPLFIFKAFCLKNKQVNIIIGTMSERIVEAYVGEYAAGKSEVAVNRALELAGRGRKVTLVDLDVVEPFYTLRPIQEELKARGVDVIAWKTKETAGLGEAGCTVKPQARWALRREGDIVVDVGYGVEGARILNLLDGVREERSLKVIAVINARRPMTATVGDIVESLKDMNRLDGLINNTHLAGETTAEVVQEGARTVSGAAKVLGLPLIATTAAVPVAAEIGAVDCMGNTVRPIKRHMSGAFW